MGGSCSCSVQNLETSLEIDQNNFQSKLEIQSSLGMKRKVKRRLSSIENTSNPNYSKYIIVFQGNTEDFENLQEQLYEMNLNGQLIVTKCYEEDVNEFSQSYRDQPNSFYQSGSSSEAINI